ncbi:hypothetical protein H6762_03235 [Candidatus Nomurabacteria bacterium]|nr:hypothetical protein [Candidatus Nomurabacteria bacterium]
MHSQGQVIKTITKIASLLNNRIKWIVGGSGALLVHGLDVIPNDIDIIIDNADYEKACELLQAFLTSSPESHGNTTKTTYTINTVEGDLLMYPIANQEIEYRSLNGQQIPVNKLELEYEFYKARTDKKEANKIKLKLIEKELARRASEN